MVSMVQCVRALIKKKTKFSSYIRKFRWDQIIRCKVIWGRASSYMRKNCTNISPYMRRPLVIYDCSPDPSEFPYLWYVRKILYSFFYQCISRYGAWNILGVRVKLCMCNIWTGFLCIHHNVKNVRTNVFGMKPKRFGIVPEFVLLKTRLLRFGPESALLDQIEMISFDKTNSVTYSKFWFHSD